MKSVILSIALLTSQICFAQIKNSKNETRHQSLIEASIQDKCGSFYNLTQYSQTESTVQIDNGIADIKYTTVIYGYSALDQYATEEYKLTVESVKSDMYDHASGQWGAYAVTSVSCAQN